MSTPFRGFAKDAADEAGGRRIGLARANYHRRQARRSSVEKAFAAIVVDQKLKDRLGDAVGGLWRLLGGVPDNRRHGAAAKDGDGAGKNQTGLARLPAQRFQDMAPTVEIDPHGKVEVFFAAAAHHRGQVEDRDVAAVDEAEDAVPVRDVAGNTG
jgi:hypothetical protein